MHAFTLFHTHTHAHTVYKQQTESRNHSIRWNNAETCRYYNWIKQWITAPVSIKEKNGRRKESESEESINEENRPNNNKYPHRKCAGLARTVSWSYMRTLYISRQQFPFLWFVCLPFFCCVLLCFDFVNWSVVGSVACAIFIWFLLMLYDDFNDASFPLLFCFRTFQLLRLLFMKFIIIWLYDGVEKCR